jgi:hypothetical protein
MFFFLKNDFNDFDLISPICSIDSRRHNHIAHIYQRITVCFLEA